MVEYMMRVRRRALSMLKKMWTAPAEILMDTKHPCEVPVDWTGTEVSS